MSPFLELLAALSAALFAGAALYISVVEHPARMGLVTRIAALQWAPSYKRATWLQAPLAIVSFLCGAGVWLLGGSTGWLVAALLVGAVVPFTFGVIMPTNHKLLAPGRDLSSAETRKLLERWGQLHAVRTALSLAGSAVFFWLMLGAQPLVRAQLDLRGYARSNRLHLAAGQSLRHYVARWTDVAP